MSEKRLWVGFAIGLICGVVITGSILFGGWIFIERHGSQPTPIVMVRIAVAAQDILQATVITREMVTFIEIPATSVVSAEFTEDELDQLIGRVARYPIQQGTVLTKALVTFLSDPAAP